MLRSCAAQKACAANLPVEQAILTPQELALARGLSDDGPHVTWT